MLRFCNIPDQEYSIPSHKFSKESLPPPIRYSFESRPRPCQTFWQMQTALIGKGDSDGNGRVCCWPARGLAKGVESQTTAAGHRPVTSSVSSKSTEQQKALRQRDGHLPPARRHLGSASWGWPADHPSSRPPLHLVISSHNLSSRMTWSEILNLVAVGRFVSGLRFNSRVSYCKM